MSYGFSPQADVRADEIEHHGLSTTFRLWSRDVPLGSLRIGIPGRHNVQNALAACAVGLELDLPFASLQSALDGFSGVDRRFSVRHEFELDGAIVSLVDDYGHHPAEITATLAAARVAWPSRRLVAVLQPHRYTRVRDLWTDFARCLHEAAHVVVCPIYAAGETAIDGIDAHGLAVAIRDHGHRSVVAVSSLDEALEHLAAVVRPGDAVFSLGAGNVNTLLKPLADRLHG